MRRISAKYAEPGMILGNSVYNNYGTKLLNTDTKLDIQGVKILRQTMITEILVHDWRVEDVPVAPLVSPELEGRAARALRKLIRRIMGVFTRLKRR